MPVFIAEIAPKDLRGGLATSNQVCKLRNKTPIMYINLVSFNSFCDLYLHLQLLICSGSSATYIVGALVAWRNLVFVGNFSFTSI